MDGAKYVYVREDKPISELVHAEEQLTAWEVEPGDVASTLNGPRSAGLVVVHDGRTWRLAGSHSS
jgi:hypothetical protein